VSLSKTVLTSMDVNQYGIAARDNLHLFHPAITRWVELALDEDGFIRRCRSWSSSNWPHMYGLSHPTEPRWNLPQSLSA
jgi:hypothetical protein